MSLPYLPGHIIDEARDLRRQGHSLATLAGRLGIDPEELGVLLGEPAWKPVAQQDADQSCDLWRADALDQVL